MATAVQRDDYIGDVGDGGIVTIKDLWLKKFGRSHGE